ncbi:MAG: ribonuclease Y [bacterium]|nr:ribonuclease Y [bacterium]
MDYNLILLGVFALAGLGAGYAIRHFLGARSVSSVEQKIKLQLEEATTRAKEVVLEAKDKAAAVFEEVKQEERDRKAQLNREGERFARREEDLRNEEQRISVRSAGIDRQNEELTKAKQETLEARLRAEQELEKLSGLSAEEARARLIKDVEKRYREDIAVTVTKLERDRLEEIEKKSLEIMTVAIQRYARSHVSELTTSSFQLPNEELKGKIIGREGRNIRALERATGVEFVIDETPDTILISSFDPLRREIARMALEKLIKDGRIQPARIEERVEEARQEVAKRMHEIGEAAAFEVGVYDLPKEIIQLLGRLHFRTSYGQNVLTHSVEMAHISAMMAADLKMNVEIAKRGALLHDIGKAIDHDVEGTHVELGRKILKKYGIDELVIRAMESHHEEYPFSTPESYIVTAADALSAARPGARRDSVENYIKRLQDLEALATGFPGVKGAYALSAGREVRVFVLPEKIDDFGALQLARDIAGKIESVLKYPGEIKVNVIREMRAVEYAR